MKQQDYEVIWERGAGRRRRLFAALAVLDALLRAIAGRRAWRNKHRVWFLTMLIVSSGGLLPLVYLIFYSGSAAATDDEPATE